MSQNPAMMTPDRATRTSGSVVLSPLKQAKNKIPLGAAKDIKDRVFNIVKRRELGWQQYVLPISKLNEQWHPS